MGLRDAARRLDDAGARLVARVPERLWSEDPVEAAAGSRALVVVTALVLALVLVPAWLAGGVDLLVPLLLTVAVVAGVHAIGRRRAARRRTRGDGDG